MPNGKPDIVVIWGDDIGITNLCCFTIDQAMEKLEAALTEGR